MTKTSFLNVQLLAFLKLSILWSLSVNGVCLVNMETLNKNVSSLFIRRQCGANLQSADSLFPCFRRPSLQLSSCLCQLQSFHIHCQKGEDPTGLVLCDIVGLGGGEMTGLTLYDILSVIKGHVPEGHKVSRISIVILSSLATLAALL